jgi:phosphonate transport system substrate-binding protein
MNYDGAVVRLRLLGGAVASVLLLLLAGCAGTAGSEPRALTISAIPDQDPEQLQRLYGLVARYLSEELGVPVEYRPVTDYTASVTAFRRGDLDAVFFGGLTGVQAREQVPGAVPLAQRDVDERFRSVFVAHAGSGVGPIADVAGLAQLRGHSLTFGSETSTSGRLMPQSFLLQAGVTPDDLAGPVGFSGSHDATIQLVASGAYEVGALNSSVWDARMAAGRVDTAAVTEVFRTPTYHDYHWVARPDLDEAFGAGFTDRLRAAFLALDPADPEEKAVLDLFTAGAFIPTEPTNYDAIEAVAGELGLLSSP